MFEVSEDASEISILDGASRVEYQFDEGQIQDIVKEVKTEVGL